MMAGATLVAVAATAWALGDPDSAQIISVSSAQSTGSAGAPVLVELFTSQGCSSCPPADRVLERLDAAGGVIALSRPVTYWDRLGWKDTLARPGNDVRQRRYAARGLPGGGVYTPEAVVQGEQAAVGSDERKVRAMIAAARRDKAVAVTQSGDRITVAQAAPGAELNFIAIARRRDVGIKAGENGQRQLGYTNVVLNEAAVACAAAGACSATIPSAIAGQRGADRWAVVLQTANNGPVQAVRWISRAAK